MPLWSLFFSIAPVIYKLLSRTGVIGVTGKKQRSKLGARGVATSPTPDVMFPGFGIH